MKKSTKIWLAASAFVIALSGVAVAREHHGMGEHGMMQRFDQEEARKACEDTAKAKPEGERREAHRACMKTKREAAHEHNKAHREAMKANRDKIHACRKEVRDQKLTEDERHSAVVTCLGKTDPALAKSMTCAHDVMKKADAENAAPKRGSKEHREAMRACWGTK